MCMYAERSKYWCLKQYFYWPVICLAYKLAFSDNALTLGQFIVKKYFGVHCNLTHFKCHTNFADKKAVIQFGQAPLQHKQYKPMSTSLDQILGLRH